MISYPIELKTIKTHKLFLCIIIHFYHQLTHRRCKQERVFHCRSSQTESLYVATGTDRNKISWVLIVAHWKMNTSTSLSPTECVRVSRMSPGLSWTLLMSTSWPLSPILVVESRHCSWESLFSRTQLSSKTATTELLSYTWSLRFLPSALCLHAAWRCGSNYSPVNANSHQSNQNCVLSLRHVDSMLLKLHCVIIALLKFVDFSSRLYVCLHLAHQCERFSNLLTSSTLLISLSESFVETTPLGFSSTSLWLCWAWTWCFCSTPGCPPGVCTPSVWP